MWIIIRNRKNIGHVLTTILFVLVACCSVSAYTIVLRDGRHFEIPNTFIVGSSTLTYEAGPGIQITWQLATVDIAATEKANGEASGSLMRRGAKRAGEVSASESTSGGSTITNEDLERFRQARVAGERNYEKRRKELGLPTLEESRRAAIEAGERAQVQLLTMQSKEQQGESYWRSRAAELRTELTATTARIAMIQTRLNELPLNYSFGAFTTAVLSFGRSVSRVTPVLSVDQLARGAGFPKATFANPQFGQPRFGMQIGFGGRSRGHFSRPGFARHGFPNRVPFGAVVALPFDSYDLSFERAQLVTQLDELLIYRAGLQARWRELEDEARRSGAYPGWLR
jgi:hypothetical protein